MMDALSIFALLGLNVPGYALPDGFSGVHFQAGRALDASMDLSVESQVGDYRWTDAGADESRRGFGLAGIFGLAPLAQSSDERGGVLFLGPSLQASKSLNSGHGSDVNLGIDLGLRSQWGRKLGWFVSVDWVRYHLMVWGPPGRSFSNTALTSLGLGFAF